ncbi:MAG: imidazole glycerol phosphate synthase subunit HisF [Phycisphaerales bacterium]|nr:imidazole glycerol phosphate synthase subunit HisF [Phycisphaerales bacterium]
MTYVAIIRTGSANLASVLAAFARAGVEARVTADPHEAEHADRVVLPGVGSFGAAMHALREGALVGPLRRRLEAGRPTLAICLGLQLLAESSEESPGVAGLGVLPAKITRFAGDLRVPQLGWNRVAAGDGCRMLADGCAYYANSYRLESEPAGWACATTDYGGCFVGAVERGRVLACQFHPELSGPWGQALIERWIAGDTHTATALHGSSRTTASGLTPRIIPCLDVRDGRIVKGVRFADLRDAGDPVERAALYEAQGADELVILDVSATPDGRRTAAHTVAKVRAVLSIPLTVGGGVRTTDDAARLLDAGADKVGVNTAAVRDPSLLTRLAERFGVQCTVLALDAARRQHAKGAEQSGGSGTERGCSASDSILVSSSVPSPSLRPSGCSWEVVVRSGSERTGIDAIDWAAEACRLGAGEILLTSFDRDGTHAGYDLDLLRSVGDAVTVPVIASGGASSASHLREALDAGADAVLAASIFHDGHTTVGDIKRELAGLGTPVRLSE